MTETPPHPAAAPLPADLRPDARPEAWPPPRRSFALPGIILAMLAVALASGAYMVWHAPLPPDADGGLRCSRAFDARMRTARGGTDADLDQLSADALAVGCGRQALDAADLADWRSDEAAAWTLSRFFDPGETAAVFRQATAPDPARAAAVEATWALRSPRMADALAKLCGGADAGTSADRRLKDACRR